jgi:hypothetical protein
MLSVDLGCAMVLNMKLRLAYGSVFHMNAGVGCSSSRVL